VTGIFGETEFALIASKSKGLPGRPQRDLGGHPRQVRNGHGRGTVPKTGPKRPWPGDSPQSTAFGEGGPRSFRTRVRCTTTSSFRPIVRTRSRELRSVVWSRPPGESVAEATSRGQNREQPNPSARTWRSRSVRLRPATNLRYDGDGDYGEAPGHKCARAARADVNVMAKPPAPPPAPPPNLGATETRGGGNGSKSSRS
jgi:hypothetical protein